MNHEYIISESIVSTGVGELKDRIVVIGDSKLLLTAEIRNQMRKLDDWVANGKYESEIFGIGLTKKDRNTTEVVEFMAPNPDYIFKLNSGLFMFENQHRLMSMLSDAKTANLHQAELGIVLACDDGRGKYEKMIFTQDGQGSIDYSFINTDLNQLFGFELPTTLEELCVLIAKEKQISRDVDFDAVVNNRQAIITRSFMQKVSQRLSKIALDVGFTVHHHPSLEIAKLILQDKDLERRQNFYHQLLAYSDADMTAMRRMGVNFFEIRALGNPENLFDPAVGVTSRYFSV